jgi:hypothetical protein
LECGDLSPLLSVAERLFICRAVAKKSRSAANESGDKSPHSIRAAVSGTRSVPDTFAGHENLSIPMKLLLFTPAFCDDPGHLGMIRVQSLLAERLRQHLACEIVSAVVVDFCRDDLKTELGKIVAPFDIVRHSPAAANGIRRPTNYAIDVLLRETGATRMLRVIQDTFIDDPATLARGIEAAMPEAGHWVAAGVERGERDAH